MSDNHGLVVGVAVLLDPSDMPSADEFTTKVLRLATESFREDRRLDQQFYLIATKPAPALVHVIPQDVGESLREAAWVHRAIRNFAANCSARALYMVSEVWISHSESCSGAMNSEPRLDPNREEAAMVLIENPLLRPPVQTWQAEIERNKGRPHLLEWRQLPPRKQTGRLMHLLPPEAYGPMGSA